MAKGRRTGGRRPGTRNRATEAVRDKLAELGCDPVEGLARIAMAEGTELGLRVKCYAELLPYVAPRLGRTVLDVDAPDHGPPPNLILTLLEPQHTKG